MTDVTVLPDPPTGLDGVNFRPKADALMAALPQFVDELNALVGTLIATAAGVASGTSATSITIGSGVKVFTMAQLNRNFAKGQFIIVSSGANPANWMFGQVNAYVPGTGVIDVNVTQTNGSGTLTDWNLAIVGPSANPTTVTNFSASGTWTKPGSGTAAIVETLGAGGAGGQGIGGNPAGGAGGGNYDCRIYTLAELAATENVVIGAGGTSASAGGLTSFGTVVRQRSYGGGGGGGNTGYAVSAGGGGGGGSTKAAGSNGVAAVSNTAGGAGGAGGAVNGVSVAGGAGGSNGVGGAGTGTAIDSLGAGGGGGQGGSGGGGVGGSATKGGGGGGGGCNGGVGGSSEWGGAGGGGGGFANAGGTSKNPLVGTPSAGTNVTNASAKAGVACGGGGTIGSSTPGGDGYCRVIVF